MSRYWPLVLQLAAMGVQVWLWWSKPQTWVNRHCGPQTWVNRHRGPEIGTGDVIEVDAACSNCGGEWVCSGCGFPFVIVVTEEAE